ncbi:hypothetical protein Y032_0046g1370 [Ancylostoma ceylanicum]|uniref:Uncharacterized protein n=1 Tax=Ancylostoma ceylanicum TaxID=53326 RepID=A0A016UCX2_9BILA|nr:hypothetical protein Y032_0046g1370 [Ancylostoma ceylanicum]
MVEEFWVHASVARQASICGGFSMKTGQGGMYILNEKNALQSQGRESVRLNCVCDVTGPILHHVDARASNARS